MMSKDKDFDCVEMKQKAQREIQEEFERSKHEFASFADFLHTRAKKSSWQNEILEKIRRRQKASA